MSARRSVYMAKVDEVLADGQARTLDELLVEVGPLIPESLACRAAEAERTRSHRGRQPPPQRVQGDRSTAVATGRRTVLRNGLAGAVSRHSITRNPDGTYQKKGQA